MASWRVINPTGVHRREFRGVFCPVHANATNSSSKSPFCFIILSFSAPIDTLADSEKPLRRLANGTTAWPVAHRSPQAPKNVLRCLAPSTPVSLFSGFSGFSDLQCVKAESWLCFCMGRSWQQLSQADCTRCYHCLFFLTPLTGSSGPNAILKSQKRCLLSLCAGMGGISCFKHFDSCYL